MTDQKLKIWASEIDNDKRREILKVIHTDGRKLQAFQSNCKSQNCMSSLSSCFGTRAF